MDSDIEQLRTRLAKLGLKQPRRWLAGQTGYKENSIRQYMGPKGKVTGKFIRESIQVIEKEEARQRAENPDAPPWNILFSSHEEFRLADRASRVVKAPTLEAFCRNAILKRADEILGAKKSRGGGKVRF